MFMPRLPVASRAEAWIETSPHIREAAMLKVASRAEAWIETVNFIIIPASTYVASRAEAWIETFLWSNIFRSTKSPPVRRRGLKPLL